MNELILDTSDSSVTEMVKDWKEGGKYSVTVSVTEGPTVGSKVHFTVDEITDYEDESAAEDKAEGGEETEAKAPKKNPALDKISSKAKMPVMSEMA